jgi:hypothetical protein
LASLSPTSFIPKDWWLVALKGYFDGGNQADSHQYDRITLATACGTCEQWKEFESAWSLVLDAHKAPFLHTTDAVSLQKEFSRTKGWDNKKIDTMISSCVDIIEGHLYVPEGIVPLGVPFGGSINKSGLMVVTLTIPLKDYDRARKVVTSLPNSVTEICTTESLGFCFQWGRKIGMESYQLYFDQGEPFYGHVCDRKSNKKARKQINPMKNVVHLGESDMRNVPALQVADLFAWCINHNDDVRREWHARLNRLPNWSSTILDYDHLVKPTPGALERTAAWNLPKRKVNR